MKQLFFNYDEDLFVSCDKLNEDQWYVEMKKADEDVNHIDNEEEYTDLLPSHLGVFILSHSKRLMNNFLFVIDGFKQPK